MQNEKSRYSDEELAEFKQIINEKLEQARKDLEFYRIQMVDMADSPEARVRGLDDGTGTSELETLNKFASRLEKHIRHLENAMIRIENKVYGICRDTGKLIPKERLKAVPHATLCMEAKMASK